MSRTIKTYSDLCDEREKMISLLAVHRQRVITDWEEIKGEFQPVRKVFGVMGKMAKGTENSPLISTGLRIVSDVFLKNFVLAKAGWVTKLAVPFVMKNYSSHLFADKGNVLFQKLGKIFRSKKNGIPPPDQYVN